jgi:hypothetical protein
MESPQEIQNELVEMAIAWGEAFSNGDYKVANRQNSKIAKRAKKLYHEDAVKCKNVLLPLLVHSNPSVRLMASVYALEFGFDIQEAELVLTNIATDPNIRLIPVMAHINLSNWNKKKNANKKDEPN